MKILYQDADLIVCIKPAGALSTDEPGGMPELIRKAIGGDRIVRTVHRLDSVVSGLMVYALSKEAASGLSAQIADGCFEKEYLAVTEGVPADKKAELRDWLLRDEKQRKTHVLSSPARDAEEAILNYSLCAEADGLGLVRVRLITGRTHQIRAQFSSRSLPLFGDRKYGSRNSQARIALWSCRLKFIHPVTLKVMELTGMPPAAEPWTRFPAEFTAQYAQEDLVTEFRRPADYGDCRFAKVCQGCAYQGMGYEKQLEKKQKLAARWLKIPSGTPPIVPADMPLGYRCRSNYLFDRGPEGKLRWGSAQRTGKPAHIRRCLLDREEHDRIAETLCQLAEKHRCFSLSSASLRTSASGGETLLTITAGSGVSSVFVQELIQSHPEIRSVVLTDGSRSGEQTILFGPGYIEDTLCANRFRIGPRSFFPTNPIQAEKLYTTALQFAALTRQERVLDACCGNGLLTLAAARNAGRVLCVERNEAALKEARRSLALNGITNVKPVLNAEYIAALARSREHFDAVFVDSTHSRLSPDLIGQVGRLAPDRIILLSGDPERLGQDMEALSRFGYRTEQLRSFDSMPFTPYLETAALLVRR